MIQKLKKYTLLFGILLNVSMLWVLCATQISIGTEEHVSQSCTIGADCHHKWHINANYQYQVLFHQISETPYAPHFNFTTPVKEIATYVQFSIQQNPPATTFKQNALRGPPVV